ncbi:MAG: ABC transporter permease subunit [Planctomycetota bacterium]
MVLTQTAAIFVDAYRELNARKLFWISVILSGLLAGVFAGIRIDETGVAIFGIDLSFIPATSETIRPDLLYKSLFLDLGVQYWLGFVATILALISTAGIFPDLITFGAIETVLSKPVGRLRLFATKYLAGLLFVTLQVGAFTVAAFLIVGIRGGAWEPRLFVAIPLVVLFFSYLFCVCVLIGLITRSTVASLLLTLLLWAALFIINFTDGILVTFNANFAIQEERTIARIERMERATVVQMRREAAARGESLPENYEPTLEELRAANGFLQPVDAELEDVRSRQESLKPWLDGVFAAKTLLPKTAETIDALKRLALSEDDLDRLANLNPESEAAQIRADQLRDDAAIEAAMRGEDTNENDNLFETGEAQRAGLAAMRSRSLIWVIGTSLLFELVILSIAAWIFCRRDF